MILLNRRKYFHKRRPQGAPADIADATITVPESVTYTGSPLTPSVTVVYDGATLVVNTDYFVNYNDNTEIGAATAVITGTGEFTGQVVKTFQIVAAGENDWTFSLDDIPATIEFSRFGNYTHYWYSQICPSQDETVLLVADGYTHKVDSGQMNGFDPSTYTKTANSNSGINAGRTLYTPDGIHYLTASYSAYYLCMYVGTVPYDVTTISGTESSSAQFYDYFSSYIDGGSISKDGTKVMLSMDNRLVSCTLSTPFDLSTKSNIKSYIVAGRGSLFVNQHNGTQVLQIMASSAVTDPVIYLYTLGTPWDASSVVSVESAMPSVKIGTNVYNSAGFLCGIAVNKAGNKIMLIGSSLGMLTSPKPYTDRVYAALLDFSS